MRQQAPFGAFSIDFEHDEVPGREKLSHPPGEVNRCARPRLAVHCHPTSIFTSKLAAKRRRDLSNQMLQTMSRSRANDGTDWEDIWNGCKALTVEIHTILSPGARTCDVAQMLDADPPCEPPCVLNARVALDEMHSELMPAWVPTHKMSSAGVQVGGANIHKVEAFLGQPPEMSQFHLIERSVSERTLTHARAAPATPATAASTPCARAGLPGSGPPCAHARLPGSGHGRACRRRVSGAESGPRGTELREFSTTTPPQGTRESRKGAVHRIDAESL